MKYHHVIYGLCYSVLLFTIGWIVSVVLGAL